MDHQKENDPNASNGKKTRKGKGKGKAGGKKDELAWTKVSPKGGKVQMKEVYNKKEKAMIVKREKKTSQKHLNQAETQPK
jgi:hypothetical protein